MVKEPQTTFYPGFSKGWKALNDDHKPLVKVRLMKILGIRNRVSWGDYKNGHCQVRGDEKTLAVAKVFSEYGVTDPWGK